MRSAFLKVLVGTALTVLACQSPAQFTVVQDIGGPVDAGSIVTNGPGSYTLTAGGNEMWGTTDQGFLAMYPQTGDFDVRVRAESVSAANRWSKVGLQLREDPNVAASHTVFTYVTPPDVPAADGGNGVNGQYASWRTLNGGVSGGGANGGEFETFGANPAYPNAWMRLTRSGNIVRAYHSANGFTWNLFETVNMDDVAGAKAFSAPIPSAAYLGFAASSHNNNGVLPKVTAVLHDYGSPSNAVQITRDPASRTNFVGQTASFSFGSAGGYDFLAIQWRSNGVDIVGATGSSYTSPAVALANNGDQYSVFVSNTVDASTATSAIATLTVVDLPQVVSASSFFDPANTNIYVNFDKDMDASAEVAANYQVNSGAITVNNAVFHNGNPRRVRLEIGTALVNGNTYSVRISGVQDTSANPLFGDPVVVNFVHMGGIRNQGLSMKRFDGSGDFNTILGKIANCVTPQRESTTMPDFEYTTSEAGDPANGNLFSDPNTEGYGTWIYGQFAPPTTGNYTFAFASDDHGELFLSTDAQPANKVMITAQPSWNCYRGFASVCGETFAPQVTVALEMGKTYYMEAVVAEGGGGDHVAVAVRKPGDPALVNGGASVSRDLFATNYHVGCPPAYYFNMLGPVVITDQPDNATVNELLPVTFRATVDGSPLSSSVAPYYGFQWYSNGVPVPGATSAAYTSNPLRYADGAVYQLVAYNGFSSVTSAPAVLTVISDSTPPTVTRAYGSAVFTNVTLVFSEPVEVVSATTPGNYSITNDAGATLTVHSASVRDLTNVVLRTDAQVSGDHYTVVINNVTDLAGVPNPVATDTAIGFTAWVFSPGFALMETYNAGGGNAVSILTGHPTYPNYPREKFYIKGMNTRLAYPDNSHENYGGRISGHFVPPVTDITVYLSSDDNSQLRASLDENPANAGVILQENGCCQPFSAIQTTLTGLTPGNRYYYEILWKEGGGGDYAQVSVDGVNPANGDYLGVYANPDDATLTIVTPPQDTIKLEGQVALFTVTATASIVNILTPPTFINYQWYSNGVVIPGANASSYQTAVLTPSNSNDLYTVITWIPGKAATNSATVGVIEDVTPPTLVRAYADETYLKVTLEFSEALDPSAAGEASNYALFDELGVAGNNLLFAPVSVVQTNGSNVVLYLASPMGVGSNYVAAAAGQVDLFGNPGVADPMEIAFQAWDVSCGHVRFEAFLGLTVPDYQNPQPVVDAVNTNRVPSFAYFTNNVNWPQSSPNLDNYGMHFYGWFRAPVTGSYKFEPAHDDSGHLYFSTDASRTNATLVMDFDCCSGFGSGEAGYTVTLNAGQDYFFDLRVVEAGGGDLAGLAVTLPDNTYLAPIPSRYLVFYASPETGAATLTGFASDPASLTIAENQRATFSVTVTSSLPAGVFYKWEVNDGSGWVTIPGANSATYMTPFLPLSANGNQYRAVASVPGLNIPSAAATVTITNDITPPTVLLARAYGTRTIELVFDEPVSVASGGEVSNYQAESLDGLLTINSATVVGDGTVVRLETPSALPCEWILVRMAGIEDRANTPNAMGLSEIGFLNFGLEHRYSFNNTAGSADNGVLTDSAGGAHGAVKGGGASFTGTRFSIPGGGSGTAPYGDLPNGLVSKHSTNNAGSGSMTIETWVKVTGARTWGRIFDIGSSSGQELNAPGGGGNGWRYVMLAAQVGNDVNTHRFEIAGEGAGAFPNGFTSDFPASFNTDTHFAVTWDEVSGRIRVYRNGNLVVDRASPIPVMSDVQDVNVWLGRSTWTGDQNMQGEYDEFRVYQRALSATEVNLSRNLGPNDHLSMPTGLSLTVPSTSVIENIFQQGTVLANFASSNGVDITSLNCYRIFSSNPGVVSVQPNGGLQALVPGTSDLTVTYGGITSSVVTITVLADTNPPVLLSARALNNPRQIEAQFSELMDTASLGESSNFQVASPAGILAIASTASTGDGSRVLITMVDPLPCETIFVSAGNVTDRATTPNTLDPNPSTVSFLNYGLEHRYTFNNGAGGAPDMTVVPDVIGGANGRVRGAGATFTGSRVTLPGGASASAAYIDLPNGLLSKHSTNNGGSGQITIEGWTKVTGNRNWSRIVDFGNSTVGENPGPGGGGDGQDYLFYSAQEGGNVNRHVAVVREVNPAPDGSTLNVENAVGFDTTFNIDIHFVITWDEATGQVRVYENGVFKGGFGTPAPMSKIADVNVWLGRSQWNGDQNMQGEFDDFRIYRRVLGTSEIAINGALGADQHASQPTALRLDIPSTTVDENIFQQAVVRADYPSTANVDITALNCYTIVSSDPTVVSVLPGAGLQAGDPGTATVTVTFGGLTNSYLITVNVDTNKPTIVSVEGVRQFNAVKVTFSERVTSASAQEVSNYQITDTNLNVITINSATLGADERTVILSIPYHAPGETYILSSAGIEDLANTANVLDLTNITFKTWVLSCGFVSFEAYLNLFVPDYQNPQPVIDAVNNGVIPSFQFYTNNANWPQSVPDINNYGMRIYGLFRAPVTGTYKFEPAHDDSGHLYFSTDNTESNAVLAMDFDCCSGFGAGEAGYFVNLTAGQDYWFDLRVVEAGGGDYAGLAVTLPGGLYLAPIPAPLIAVPAPPTGVLEIASQPANVSFDLAASTNGEMATFTVSVTASNGPSGNNPPVFYQWYRNGNLIAGANGPSYSLLPCIADNGAQFTVKVSIVGENPVTSQVATLTVINPASLSITRSAEFVCAGESSTLTAVTDARSPSYLWSPGGATTAGITVSPVTDTTYTVVVTDGVTGCSYTATTQVQVADQFVNATPISIPGSGAASVYPSTITVSGLNTLVSKVTVTLSNVNHAWPDDLEALLVGPGGQTVHLMSDAGGGTALSGVVLTFDDAAAGGLPDATAILSGVYLPTNHDDGRADVFDAPAPAGPYGATMSGFNGTDPNGVWSLYILDDASPDGGSIGGWSICIWGDVPFTDLAISKLDSPDPVAVGSNLTYTITVTNQGLATAENVVVTDILPAGVDYVTSSSSQGSTTNDSGTVYAYLGSIPAGGSATVTIVVSPNTDGTPENSASVASTTVDLNMGNNEATTTTTVIVPVTIDTPPVSIARCVGENASFSVVASGGGTLTYTWYSNGVAIANGTSISFTGVTPDLAATYSVTVANEVSSSSASATLTVNPLPSVSVNNVTVAYGNPAVLTATTSASNPSYLWSPGGETTASITNNATTNITYTVTVTDGITGCINSASGNVTIAPAVLNIAHSTNGLVVLTWDGQLCLEQSTVLINGGTVWVEAVGITNGVPFVPTGTNVFFRLTNLCP